MKRYLILCALAATAASRAGSVVPAAHPMTEVKQRATASTPAVAKAPALPRHLSDQERLELRRQLYQFNRQYGKRS